MSLDLMGFTHSGVLPFLEAEAKLCPGYCCPPHTPCIMISGPFALAHSLVMEFRSLMPARLPAFCTQLLSGMVHLPWGGDSSPQ